MTDMGYLPWIIGTLIAVFAGVAIYIKTNTHNPDDLRADGIARIIYPEIKNLMKEDPDSAQKAVEDLQESFSNKLYRQSLALGDSDYQLMCKPKTAKRISQTLEELLVKNNIIRALTQEEKALANKPSYRDRAISQ